MKLYYKGKTKDVYCVDDNTFVLKFKDDATGKDGVFDPGENAVGLSIEGLGKEGLKVSRFFYTKLEAAGIPTHYIDSNINDATMTVKAAKPFGQGLEVICRLVAVGSFVKRYGKYIESGSALDYFVEYTLKDDDRCDPPITKDALVMLNLMTETEYEDIKAQTKILTKFVKDELEKVGAKLYDIKFEFGKTNDGKVVLMDEISGGNMRVFKDGKAIEPMQVAKLLGIN